MMAPAQLCDETNSCCFGHCGLVNRNHFHRRRGTPRNERVPPRRRSVWRPHRWWRPRTGADLQFLRWRLHRGAIGRDARLAGEPRISVPLRFIGITAVSAYYRKPNSKQLVSGSSISGHGPQSQIEACNRRSRRPREGTVEAVFRTAAIASCSPESKNRAKPLK